jgi:competence ComEA-like helix-hairpin-helix protein
VSKPKPPPAYTAEKKDWKQNNYKPQKYKTYPKRKYPGSTYSSQHASPPSQPIQIDSASVDELKSTGLSAKVSYNVYKYLRSGGMITHEGDLMRIYGMDSIQLQNAAPYLIWQQRTEKTKEKHFTSKKDSKVFTPMNINDATSADLESLPGIGKVLAERIVKFRESLGGFFQTDQLLDCYGLTPETFEKIKDHIIATGEIHIIPVNEVDLASFTHPYLNKKMAKILDAYIDQHGPVLDESELKRIYPPDSTWCEKLLPYIEF